MKSQINKNENTPKNSYPSLSVANKIIYILLFLSSRKVGPIPAETEAM